MAAERLVRGVSVFDLYAGEGIGAGMKSLALSVTLRSPDRTLTDADIEAAAEKIVANVIKQTDGTLRG